MKLKTLLGAAIAAPAAVCAARALAARQMDCRLIRCVFEMRTMAEQGHEIAGHSWDHRQLTKLSPQEITDQLMLTRAKILDTTGVDSTIMRPPYGSCNDTVREQASAADNSR